MDARKNIIVISNGKTYFFSTDHNQDHQLGSDYIPCTHTIPSKVTPIEGVRTGCIDNVDQLIDVFYKDMVEIPNPRKAFQPRYPVFAYHTEKPVCSWINHQPVWCGDCYACMDCGVMFTLK